jgi:hypothetical protein
MALYFDQAGNRPGSLNGGSDKRELFLKVFSGEIISQYETKCVMKDLIRTRSISSGKSASFPLYGSATAKWHTPGQNILEKESGYLTDFKYAERILTLDNMLTANTLINDVDELINHWDVRSPIATELGRALAYAYDRFAMSTFWAAVNTTTSPISGVSANGTPLVGETIAKGSTAPTGTQILDSLYEAQVALDNKDVPVDGRFCVVRPEQYQLILATPAVNTAQTFRFSKDYGSGMGDVSKGTAATVEVAGFKLMKSNLFPRFVDLATGAANIALFANANSVSDVFAAGGVGYSATADAAGTSMIKAWGICGHADAIGCVKKFDVTTEMERKIEYQGTLVVSKMMAGFGVLRPECAIGLALA